MTKEQVICECVRLFKGNFDRTPSNGLQEMVISLASLFAASKLEVLTWNRQAVFVRIAWSL